MTSKQLPRGRFSILSTACSLAPNVPGEHVRLMSEIAREHGCYAQADAGEEAE